MLTKKGEHEGGFARLKTIIDENTIPGATLLLDSGDFSMGSIFQSFCVTDATELTLLDELNYDAVALGNHDFEVTEAGLKQELTVFHEKGGRYPLLCSNLTDGRKTASVLPDENPLKEQGVHNYTVIEPNGFRIGVFCFDGL